MTQTAPGGEPDSHRETIDLASQEQHINSSLSTGFTLVAEHFWQNRSILLGTMANTATGFHLELLCIKHKINLKIVNVIQAFSKISFFFFFVLRKGSNIIESLLNKTLLLSDYS